MSLLDVLIHLVMDFIEQCIKLCGTFCEDSLTCAVEEVFLLIGELFGCEHDNRCVSVRFFLS